jgi:hypothetical protein
MLSVIVWSLAVSECWTIQLLYFFYPTEYLSSSSFEISSFFPTLPSLLLLYLCPLFPVSILYIFHFDLDLSSLTFLFMMLSKESYCLHIYICPHYSILKDMEFCYGYDINSLCVIVLCGSIILCSTVCINFFFVSADTRQPCVHCCLHSGQLEVLPWPCVYRREYTSSLLWRWLPPVSETSDYRSALYTGLQTTAMRICYV